MQLAHRATCLRRESRRRGWDNAARIACDAIERAVIAERIEWTGDKYGGFEPPGPDQPYELPIPWSAVLDAEEGPEGGGAMTNPARAAAERRLAAACNEAWARAAVSRSEETLAEIAAPDCRRRRSRAYAQRRISASSRA